MCRLLFIAVSLCDGLSWGNQGCLFIEIALEKFSKLFETNLGISISVNATYNGKHFLLDQVVAEASEEVLKIGNVDGSLLVLVDCAEGGVTCVVWLELQISNDLLHPANE